MALNLDKYTQKAQAAVIEAQRLAEAREHASIEPTHLLLALIQQSDGVVPAIVTQIAGSPDLLRNAWPFPAGIGGAARCRAASLQHER